MFNGIVNVYKEQGYTSHDVVAKLRGIYGQKKVGHTGTLDPMAEGVLIVVLGQATKLSDIIVSGTKRYIATMRLGLITETDDITGEIKKSYSRDGLMNKFSFLSDEISIRNEIHDVMMKYLGKSMQVPPMYSAIKVNGKKLYEYAREGKTIELLPRPIEIYSLDVLSVDMDTLDVRFGVVCSKGTYIRSLIRDIGNDLGTGATMSALLRDEVNGIRYEDGYKISDLQKLKEIDRLATSVLPMDEILKDTPAVNIKPSGEKYLDNGNRLIQDDFDIQGEASIYTLNASQFFRVYSEGKLRALYVYDNVKNDYKVYKML